MKGEFDKVKMMQWAELIRQANDSPLDRTTWCKENAVSGHVMSKCGFKVVFEGAGEYQGEQRAIFKSVWKAGGNIDADEYVEDPELSEGTADDTAEDRYDERVHEHLREVQHVSVRQQLHVIVQRIALRQECVGVCSRLRAETGEDDPQNRQYPDQRQHSQK